MAGGLDAVQPLEEVSIRLEPDDIEALLRSWLGELLYIFHVRKLLLCEFSVSIDDNPGDCGLSATARGEPLDAERHKADVEVKAVTWHGLKVERTTDGWLAEVIVDI
jgi:SHS2 domain-containing protein